MLRSSRNISNSVEAWIKESHFDMSEDIINTALTERDEPQPNKGVLAFEDNIEENYNIDVKGKLLFVFYALKFYSIQKMVFCDIYIYIICYSLYQTEL